MKGYVQMSPQLVRDPRSTFRKDQGLVIIGAGPAGLAPLFAAANTGRLGELLRLGVTILERGYTPGAGVLREYGIGSDSSAEAMIAFVTESEEPFLAGLQSHPLTRAVAAYGKGPAPLHLVGKFLALAGSTLCEVVASSSQGCVLLGASAVSVQKTLSGSWKTKFIDATGCLQEITSPSVLVATGAHQPLDRLRTEPVAGVPLLPAYGTKLLQSGEVLSTGGVAEVMRRIAGKPNPKIAIVGGSTSAAAVANLLLTRLPGVQFSEAAVTLLHRRPLRIYYESAAEAVAEGYLEFCPDDICPLTKRVFRLSGFRLESRELIMRAQSIGNRPPEPRLRLLRLDLEPERDAQACLRDADLIVAAMGYTPRLIPVFDTESCIRLYRPNGIHWSVVDERSRLLTSNRVPLQGLYALGLAVGPGASRQLGGEAGFSGQVNSLWLWQHTLGQAIADQVLRTSAAEQASGARVPDGIYGQPVAITAENFKAQL